MIFIWLPNIYCLTLNTVLGQYSIRFTQLVFEGYMPRAYTLPLETVIKLVWYIVHFRWSRKRSNMALALALASGVGLIKYPFLFIYSESLAAHFPYWDHYLPSWSPKIHNTSYAPRMTTA